VSSALGQSAVLNGVPSVALAVFAHPDDPEVACAGTLLAWRAGGCTTHLVICNRGDKGTSSPDATPDSVAAMRAAEAAAAADVLGLASHEILDHPDGELENDVPLRSELVARIRGLRPDVVIAPDPTAVFFGETYVNHHDHRAAGWAVLDACAPMAGSRLYFPETGDPHHVSTVLLAGTLEPDVWIDIGHHLDAKVEALRCHRSQLGDGDDVVAEVVRQRAEDAGAQAGLRYAEGFRRLVF
jgi:LmbE family N-acetylglucosaminyl deacetylase